MKALRTANTANAGSAQGYFQVAARAAPILPRAERNSDGDTQAAKSMLQCVKKAALLEDPSEARKKDRARDKLG